MSREQIAAAFERSQQVRCERAELRARVKGLDYAGGRYELAAVLEEGHKAALATVPVLALLKWVKGMYRDYALRHLSVAGTTEYRVFRELTPRQVGRLVELLRMSADEFAEAEREIEAERWAARRGMEKAA